MYDVTQLRFRTLFLLMLLAALAVVPAVSAQAPAPDDETLVIGVFSDAGSLDPAQVSGGNFSVLMHMFGTLYELGQASGSINPYLANSYAISEDGSEWTFTLEEGLTCADGEAFTAEDAAFSWNRVADPANGFTGNSAGFVVPSLGFIEARADSDQEVTLVFEGPQNVNLRLGLISEVFVHCKDSYEAMSLEEAASNPVGIGAYNFGEWVTGDYLTMTRRADWTLRGGEFDTVVWRVFPEQSTATAEMVTGNVDLIKGLAADQVEPINNSGVAEVLNYASTNRFYVGFNMTPGNTWSDIPGAEAIKDTAVRVALQYAVDTSAICTQLLAAECERSPGPVNPPNDNPDLEPYPYDPAQAEALLDAAGWPRGENGERFALTLVGRNRPGPGSPEVAQAIAQMLTDVGVTTNVEILENATFIEQLIAHEVGPLFIISSGGSTWSAQYDLADFDSIEGETNYTEWANQEFFDLKESLPSLIDDPEAERATELQMLEIFYNDPPWLLLYPGPTLEAVSNRLNYTPRNDIFTTVYDVTLAE